MANLVITKYCQRSCEYCFVPSEWRSASRDAGLMTLDDFRYACEFVKQSGRLAISLLGGEPTTHPLFPLFVERALEMGLTVRIVTHGEVPTEIVDFLKRFDRETVTLLVNLSGSLTGEVHLTPNQGNLLGKLGPMANLSFTLGEARPDVSCWVQLVQAYNLSRHIRLGIAHPAPDLHNCSLLPEDRRHVGDYVAAMAEQLGTVGIELGFDCGLTPCMFGETAQETLERLGVRFAPMCGPIPDIGPGLETWHCFPCYDLGRGRLTDWRSLEEAKHWLAGLTQAYRAVGIREACLYCPYQLREECSGGCIGHVLASFGPTAARNKSR